MNSGNIKNWLVVIIVVAVLGGALLWRSSIVRRGILATFFPKTALEEAKRARSVNDAAGAKQILEDTIARHPDDMASKAFLATLILEAESLHRNYGTGADAAELEKAEKLARDILAGNPNNAQAHILLGSVFENHGDYQNAIAEYEKSFAIAPSAAALFYEGRINELAGKYIDAKRFYDRAIALDPQGSTVPIVTLKLAQIALLTTHDTVTAESYAQKVLSLTNDFYLKAETYLLLANISFTGKKYIVARDYVQKSLESYPDWSRALVLKGDIELATMSVFGAKYALDDWQKAADINPTLTIALWRLAKAKLTFGYIADAKVLADRALVAVKSDPTLREPGRKALEKQLSELQTQIARHEQVKQQLK